MPDKDPLAYDILTWGWVVFLAVWGGIVNFLRKVRNGESRKFNFTELIGEICTSGFVGVMTFLLCEAAATDQLLTAVLVGISGHMGAKAIRFLEMVFEKRIGQ